MIIRPNKKLTVEDLLSENEDGEIRNMLALSFDATKPTLFMVHNIKSQKTYFRVVYYLDGQRHQHIEPSLLPAIEYFNKV